MKNMYNMMVYINDAEKFEKALNRLRIGLNDWDKTRVMILNGERVVNYTVICEQSVCESIINIMRSY